MNGRRSTLCDAGGRAQGGRKPSGGRAVFNHLSLTVLAVLFVAAAGVTWVAGLALARTTDVLSVRLNLGEALGGLLLLAVATNLPEIAITVSAALSGQMEVAVGNILGGIAIQTVVLAAMDRAGGKGPPLTFRAASLDLVLEGLLVVAVLAVAIMGAQLPAGGGLIGAGAAPLAITAVWIAGVWMMVRARRGLPWHAAGRAPEGQEQPRGHSREAFAGRHGGVALVGTVAVFAVAALATLAAGVVLERAGSVMADRLGLSGVVFGATVLAAATALPELSTGIASVRMKDYRLAVSDIFGGNAFLPVLLLPAALLSGQAVLPQAGPATVYLAALGAVLTCVYLAGLIFRPTRRPGGMGLDSWAVLALYAVGVAGLTAIPAAG